MCPEQGCVKLSVKIKIIYLKQNFTQRWNTLPNLYGKKNLPRSTGNLTNCLRSLQSQHKYLMVLKRWDFIISWLINPPLILIFSWILSELLEPKNFISRSHLKDHLLWTIHFTDEKTQPQTDLPSATWLFKEIV